MNENLFYKKRKNSSYFSNKKIIIKDKQNEIIYSSPNENKEKKELKRGITLKYYSSNFQKNKKEELKKVNKKTKTNKNTNTNTIINTNTNTITKEEVDLVKDLINLSNNEEKVNTIPKEEVYLVKDLINLSNSEEKLEGENSNSKRNTILTESEKEFEKFSKNRMRHNIEKRAKNNEDLANSSKTSLDDSLGIKSNFNKVSFEINIMYFFSKENKILDVYSDGILNIYKKGKVNK
jgi:hypothetical protein